ncbi:hypothetical protein DRN93_05540 [archaeon]|nr:MAG: hypothetical protein DRN93_05540 [archaeon]
MRFKEVPPVEHERRNGHKPSFKSPYEERFSYFLKAAHIPYEHETRVVLLREELIYVPDFYLPNTGLFIELKGRLGPRGKKKISAFLDEHPDSLLYLDKQSLRRFHLI